MLSALLFVPALLAIAWVVLRPRPEWVLDEPAAGAPPTVSGEADPLDAIDALLDELERALLDERDAGELEALAAQLEWVAAHLERVG